MKIYQFTYKTSVADNHFFIDIKEMRWYCVIMFDSDSLQQRVIFMKCSDNIDENMIRTYCEPFEYVLPDTINYTNGSLTEALQKIESGIILEIFNKI